MDTNALPTDINDAHALIMKLQREVQNNLLTLEQKQLPSRSRDTECKARGRILTVNRSSAPRPTAITCRKMMLEVIQPKNTKAHTISIEHK